MNTIWLKIAAGVVAVFVVIVVVGKFKSSEPAPAPRSQRESQESDKPKTFYDMADRDKQFGEAPEPATEPESASQQEPAAQPQSTDSTAPPADQETQAAQPTAPTENRVILPSELTEKRTLYFKPMTEIEEVEAERLLPYATAGRSIGRLPVMQYGMMVKACRQILDKWPDSWYAFRAKQMLEEIYERYARNYKITKEELDITKFLIQREGTEPRIVEPIQ